MSVAREHADWLSLLDISGPFLSLPVLQRAFPQGIEAISSGVRGDVRSAYAHWLDERYTDPSLHHRWVRWILKGPLELEEACLAEGPRIPGGLERHVPEHHETLRPDIALLDDAGKAALLIHIHPPAQDLTKPLRGAVWKASPDTRMAELLRGTGVPLGLVTNGERWMLVHAAPKETAGYASWYGDLWVQEPLTLRAFVALFRRGRFFGVTEGERLPALLRDSAQDQADVTDQLGAQVRAAVQVLVQAFDKLDAESARALLAGVDERALYEAALTVMMRLVFLLSAEERKLLLRGDPIYDQHYAVGTILDSLQERADRHGEEILERSCDAWSRLLAVFRAVHGGVQHERLRLPAYGGTLFDPDRFPFLEGRAISTRWKVNAANPLKVNNRVVLHLLRALQFIETKLPGGGELAARRLSFRGLDIEQIGHVYEGLLDHTARRASQVILGLGASKGRMATLPLERLEAFAAGSQEKLINFLVDETERSESTIRNALGGREKTRGKKAAPPEFDLFKLAEAPAAYRAIPHAVTAACDHDPSLAARVAPFAALLRNDSFARPHVILPGSLYVAPASDRRSTGTHYTPRSLTEPIVQHTLEPLVYHGPAEGLPSDQWRLKTPREILALKVCDFAMGSGAFLVAACRYLSARIVESWAEVERAHPNAFITSPEGDLSTGDPSEALLARLPEDERLHLAARAVADRCLYGVDINPMAVEMAKLSLWLITVDRERPFTFLDHAFKCGDSLLGLIHTRQLERFSLREADGAQPLLETANLWRHVRQAADLRCRLEATPSHTASQLAEKTRLHCEAENALAKLRSSADLLIAAELDSLGERGWDTRRAIAASHMQAGWKKDELDFQRLAREELRGRRPFHWPLEFPEIFGNGDESALQGFDAFVGNPPFIGGKKISGEFGSDYRDFIIANVASAKNGVADLCAYFFLRAFSLLQSMHGMEGLVATNTIAQGDTREVGLEQLVSSGAKIFRAVSSRPWPGVAALEVSHIWLKKGGWKGACILDDREVGAISPFLTEPGRASGKPLRLEANAEKSFIGSYVLGMGFILTQEQAQSLLARDDRYRAVLFPYLVGEDLNSRPDQSASRWVINFHDWPLNRSAEGNWRDASEKQREGWLRSGVVPKDYSGPVAADFPACLEIVDRLVKPERTRKNDLGEFELRYPLYEKWWIYADKRPGLYSALRQLRRTLAVAVVTHHVGFAIVTTPQVFAHRLALFPNPTFACFGLLQSNIHEPWAREYSSSLETRINYSPSDCFETFPFPAEVGSLEIIGELYHEHRRRMMEAREEGLTKIYNRFHNQGPRGEGADISELRALHRQLDVAVAAAYGWTDLTANDGAGLGHDFHETKQGVRFTLSPAARREVLDRLLSLNHQRHAEEVTAGLHAKKKAKGSTRKKTPSGASAHGELVRAVQDDLFDTPPSPDPAAFAMELVVNLLSIAPGLRLSELARAFRFVADPARMKRDVQASDRTAVDMWARNWQSPTGPERFITTIQRLAGGTVKAKTDEDDPPMELLVPPSAPDSPMLREGIRLALRLVSSVAMSSGEYTGLVRDNKRALSPA